MAWDQNACEPFGVSKGIFPTLQVGIGAELISVAPEQTKTPCDVSASVRRFTRGGGGGWEGESVHVHERDLTDLV